ncbi:MAG: amino acid adenylation domain-containing protein, partial [Bryobacterales bacterium]|nr:amino acid adenylation domain-containing protein [Bryobacterales bacterium]
TDGTVSQRVVADVQVKLPFTDLGNLPAGEREAEAARIAAEDVRRPFELNAAPLFRLRLVRLAEDYHRIYLTVHRLVFDCVSIEHVLMEELAALYSAYSTGQPSPLAELAFQYSDYAAWKRRQMEGASHTAQMEYWRQKLAGDLAPSALPTDRPRTTEPACRSAMETFAIPAQLTEAVTELAQNEGVTPYMILLAAFQILMYRYSGQDEIVVGGKTNTRTRPEFEPLIGSLVNTIVFRTQMESDLSFREFLARVKTTVLGALAHSEIPFDAIVRELAPKRDPGRHPLFQVLFSMRALFANFPDGWDLTDMEVDSGASIFELFVEFAEQSHGLAGRFVYRTDLFDRATIQRWQANFLVLLKELISSPAQTMARVPLLTEWERQTVLVDWNDTGREYPPVRIHELFEAQVDKSPERPALVFQAQQLTYAQVNARSNRLAHYLRQCGAARGAFIGVCMERSFEMVVALLAILKSGAAYVPYDPELPLSRLQMMLDDSCPECVITQRKFSRNLAGYSGKTILLDGEEFQDHPDSNLGINVDAGDAIYAIYTSGSTGAPKAAINTHRAVANRILWMQDQYALDATDRVLQKTPYSFDVSVWEFFWPITFGATLVIAEPGGHRDAAYIANLIGAEAITTIHFVPSMLREFLGAGNLDRCGSLKRVFASGEALPPDLRDKFYHLLNAELHNLYGPTEAAVDVTYWDCTEPATCATVPIGRPISNVKIYILDRHLAPVPIGVSGELHIGGIALAREYLNRPDLTAAQFIADPFDYDQCGARLYKTGDVARFLADGNIEYLGRLDNQVKLRGFRIELGDIEASLLQNSQVRAAAVVLTDDEKEGQRLVGYVVPSGAKLDVHALREFLKERVPEHMIPAAFAIVESLPKTTSGKLDRKALPVPEIGSEREREFVAPSDVIEERLASLWQEILGVRPIGVTDNYFDLGGHSLQALRLFSEIKVYFELELPLATLFYAPTVRTMAGIIRDSGILQVASPVVPIQPNGTKPPIFCIGPLGGEVILFRRLALELGQDQPLYGLQPFSLGDPLSTLEQIAASYIEQLRQRSEHQPFCLLGYSFGGLVAVEMAQQLRKNKAQAPMVALIDSAYLSGCKALEPWRERIQRYRYHVRQIVHGGRGLSHLIERLRCSSFRMIHRVSTSLGVEPPKIATDIIGRQLLAAESYRAKPYPERVYLFKAESRPEFFDDPNLGWGGILSDLVIEEVPGDHGTINTGVNLKILARKLTGFLEEWSSLVADRRTAARRPASAASLASPNEPGTITRRHSA